MSHTRDRLLKHFTNPFPEDRFVTRFNANPGDGSGYALEALNFSHYMAVSAWRAAEKYGVSYRQFYVGAVALTASPAFDQLGFLHGANIKPDEAGIINEHAEDIVVNKARRYGMQIMSLMVVGNTQPDHQSHLNPPTLHPCGRCRDMLSASENVVLPTTTIFSASPDGKTYEMYGLSALRQYHQTGNPDTPGIWRFRVDNLDNWSAITLPIFAERLEEIGALAA